MKSKALLVCLLFVLDLGTAAYSAPVARRRLRARPSAKQLARAKRLIGRAHNVRTLRVPLRRRLAQRQVFGAINVLDKIGVKFDKKVPIFFASAQEHKLLHEASKLLRGAPKGSEGYSLRREAVLRKRTLQRTTSMMAPEMKAYSAYGGGKPELGINLDVPFYGKLHRLLPIIGHEARHLRDIARALSLEQRVAALAQTPGKAAQRSKTKLERKVQWLWTRSNAETRAFEQQARVMGQLAQPLGRWWRAPSSDARLDKAYPPARLNRALLRGYFAGINRRIAAKMKTASPEVRAAVRSYLAAYKKVLRSQAEMVFGNDAAVIERYKNDGDVAIARARELIGTGETIPSDKIAIIAAHDAYVGQPPRVDALLP